MRISTIQAFNNSVSGISRNYADLTRTQAEISAGKRLLTPADDPVGAVRLLQLNQEQALNSQYKSGITAAKNSLQQEETILNSVGTVIHRIREIAVQAGNGGLDASDKNALATELAQREDELLNLLNSRDASGKYLFSGSQGDTQPFVRNPDGTYSYNGDEGQREVQIASSTFIAISDNGKILFESGSNANRVSTGKDAAGPDASGNPSDSSISLGLVTDKEAYDTVFPSSTPPLASDGVGIHFTDAKNYVVYDLKTIPPGYDWSTSDPNPPSFATLASGKIDDNAQTSDFITFGGVKVQIDGEPQGGDTFSIKRQPDQEAQLAQYRVGLAQGPAQRRGHAGWKPGYPRRGGGGDLQPGLFELADPHGPGTHRRADERRRIDGNLHRRRDPGEYRRDLADPGSGLP